MAMHAQGSFETCHLPPGWIVVVHVAQRPESDGQVWLVDKRMFSWRDGVRDRHRDKGWSRLAARTGRPRAQLGRACCIEWNGFLPGACHKKFIYPSSSTSIPRLVVCLVPSFFLFSFSEKPTARACHANIQREKPKNNTKPNNLAKN